MKTELHLNAKGVEIVSALACYCMRHGTFHQDAQLLAAMLVDITDSWDESKLSRPEIIKRLKHAGDQIPKKSAGAA